MTMIGRIRKAQVVIGQQMTNPMTEPIKIARMASVIAAAGSAVTPLIFFASDWRRADMTPGALSLVSCHAICFLKMV